MIPTKIDEGRVVKNKMKVKLTSSSHSPAVKRKRAWEEVYSGYLIIVTLVYTRRTESNRTICRAEYSVEFTIRVGRNAVF